MKTLTLEKRKDYVIIQINNGKVNAIDTALLEDLKAAFDELEKEDEVKGAILSGRPHVFSAGLDIVHLTSISEKELTAFWEKYMYAMQAMLSFSKPLVCAITGYAPAGATILTLLTDYRVMGKGEKHVIGMHEFKMQMQIPHLLCDVYAYHLGEKKAWTFVQQARLFNSDEALRVGLVDESVEVEEVLPRAEKHLQKLIGVYGKVFSQSKEWFRKDLRKIVMERDVKTLARQHVEFHKDPYLVKMVKMFVAGLKK